MSLLKVSTCDQGADDADTSYKGIEEKPIQIDVQKSEQSAIMDISIEGTPVNKPFSCIFFEIKI